MMYLKRIITIFLILVMLLSVLSACGSGNETPAPSASPSPTPSAEPSPTPAPTPTPTPEPTPQFVNRFTGLPEWEDTELVRPIAVIFNNFKKAVPQRGISEADILIEALAEGGITRLMGVFTDVTAAEELGSVRSMRPYFIDFVKCIDPIYIHAGGSDGAYIKIKNEGITNIDGVNGSDTIFFRDSWRKQNLGYEHSLMVDTSLIAGYLEKRGIRSELSESRGFGFTFEEGGAPAGTAITKLTAEFSSSKTTAFTYSADDGLFYAEQHGGKMTDELTDAQLAVKNVMVLKMPSKVLDDVGRLSITSTGSGSGCYACNGGYTEITWSRDASSNEFTFTTASGEALIMEPGVTYICVLPASNADVIFE